MKNKSTKTLELKEKQTLKVKLPNGEIAYLKFGKGFTTETLQLEIANKEGFIGGNTRADLSVSKVHLTRIVDEVSGFCELEESEFNGITDVAKVKK